MTNMTAPYVTEQYSAEHNVTLSTSGPTFVQLPDAFHPQPPLFIHTIDFIGFRTGEPCDGRNATELEPKWGRVIIDMLKLTTAPCPACLS